MASNPLVDMFRIRDLRNRILFTLGVLVVFGAVGWVDDWRKVVPSGAITVRFRALRRLERYRVPHLLAPFTCVEQIKALLGLRAWWVVTPRQLHRRVRDGIQ